MRAHSIIFALLFQPEKLVDDFRIFKKFEVVAIEREGERVKERQDGMEWRQERKKTVTIFKSRKKSCVTRLLV